MTKMLSYIPQFRKRLLTSAEVSLPELVLESFLRALFFFSSLYVLCFDFLFALLTSLCSLSLHFLFSPFSSCLSFLLSLRISPRSR